MSDAARGSFGARYAGGRDDSSPGDGGPQPVPVLHVGEVHAELRLHITADTLSDLGSQIASMLASAVQQGFTAGVQASMDELDEPEPDDRAPAGFAAGGAMVPPRPAFNDTGSAETVLTEEDLRRARGG